MGCTRRPRRSTKNKDTWKEAAVEAFKVAEHGSSKLILALPAGTGVTGVKWSLICLIDPPLA